MHCTMDDLLALRANEGSAWARRHLDECSVCQTELEALYQRVARLKALPPLGDDRIADRGPAVARGPERRQRLEAGYALVQRLQLRPARRALVQVPARPGRPFLGPQREQIVHCAVHHGAAPSASSMPRSRACARASCDLEKLTVLPISSPISSCV